MTLPTTQVLHGVRTPLIGPATLRGRPACSSLRGAQRTKQSRPAERRLHEIASPGTARLRGPPSGGRNDSGTGLPAMPNALYYGDISTRCTTKSLTLTRPP